MTVPAQNTEIVNVTSPAAAVNGAAVTTAEIDVAGFSHLQVIVQIGAADAAFTELKLEESDTSGSGYTDVPNCVYGTSTDIDGVASVLPADSADNTFYIFEVNLQGRKRYMNVSATVASGTAGAFVSILAIKSRAGLGQLTKADRKVAGNLRK